MNRLFLPGLLAVGFAHCVSPFAGADVPSDIRQVRSAVMMWLVTGESFESSLERGAENEPAPRYIQGPSMRVLAEISLPENPLDHEVRDYVWEILTASLGQNLFTARDPQVDMLARIGADHIELLFETLSGELLSPMDMAQHVLDKGWYQCLGPGHPLRENYVIEAIRRITGEEHKGLLLERLADYNDLVKVVVERGWVHEARDTLLDVLNHPASDLPVEWIEAVAQLQEPTTYPQLKALFVKGPRWYRAYQALESLPGLELSDAVDEVWSQVKDDPWGLAEAAPVAIRFGHKEALSYLVERLGARRGAWEPDYGIRDIVLRYIDFNGSNRDIVQWYEKHENELEFDKQRAKFVLP